MPIQGNLLQIPPIFVMFVKEQHIESLKLEDDTTWYIILHKEGWVFFMPTGHGPRILAHKDVGFKSLARPHTKSQSFKCLWSYNTTIKWQFATCLRTYTMGPLSPPGLPLKASSHNQQQSLYRARVLKNQIHSFEFLSFIFPTEPMIFMMFIGLKLINLVILHNITQH